MRSTQKRTSAEERGLRCLPEPQRSPRSHAEGITGEREQAGIKQALAESLFIHEPVQVGASHVLPSVLLLPVFFNQPFSFSSFYYCSPTLLATDWIIGLKSSLTVIISYHFGQGLLVGGKYLFSPWIWTLLCDFLGHWHPWNTLEAWAALLQLGRLLMQPLEQRSPHTIPSPVWLPEWDVCGSISSIIL